MIAPQSQDFRQTVRYAQPGYASLPASRDPACGHRLVSCRIRITPDSACQEKSEITYGLINTVHNAAAPVVSPGGGGNGAPAGSFGPGIITGPFFVPSPNAPPQVPTPSGSQ